MPIPNPSLDDISFEQLIDSAKKNIPMLSKKWTNFNISDPGITILELLAWLIESKIYRLNKIPRENYLKFLKLLGVKPQKQVGSVLEVTLQMGKQDRGPNGGSIKIPKGFPFINSNDGLFLETKDEINFVPSLRVGSCVVYSNNRYAAVNLPTKDTLNTVDKVSNTSGKSMAINKEFSDNFENFPNFPLSLFSSSEPYFYLFGTSPKKNDAFYLSLEIDENEVKKDDQIEISFYLYEKDLPPKGNHGCGHTNSLENFSSLNKLKWEFAKNYYDESSKLIDIKWVEFSDNTDFKDNTKTFTRNGSISFKFPLDTQFISRGQSADPLRFIDANVINRPGQEPEQGSRALWIRCTLEENKNYYIPPRIEAILTNTVSCELGYTTIEILKNKSSLYSDIMMNSINDPGDQTSSHSDIDPNMVSNGLVNQVFELQEKSKLPIQRLHYLIVYNKKHDRHDYLPEDCQWHIVDDFDSSKPLDNHYMVLDKTNGLIKFGDGENGKIPEKDSTIGIKYSYGEIRDDRRINECTFFEADITQIKNTFGMSYSESNRIFFRRLIGTNFFSSSPSKSAESISDTLIRARQELIQPFKIVSDSDCEYIARETPGIRVGKVRAKFASSSKPGEENTIIVSAIPYSIQKIPEREMCIPFEDAIQRHLDDHKIITTTIRVLPIKYVAIAIDVKLKLRRIQTRIDKLRDKYVEILSNYFSPLIQNSSSNKETWNFGQNVYRSKIISFLKSIPEVENVYELKLYSYEKVGNHIDEEGNIIIDDLNLVQLKNAFISFV